jgi:ethanolamine utilization microcompartment shell protein EutS
MAFTGQLGTSDSIPGNIMLGYVATGGTVYEQAVAGIFSAAATLTRLTGKPFAGAFTAAGAIARGIAKSSAGAFSAAGTLSRAVGKALGGDWSALGELLVIPEALHVFLEGVWSATGSVTRATTKGFAGTLVLSGTVARGIAKFLSGVWSGLGAFVKVRIPRMVAPLYVDSVTGPDNVQIDSSNDTVEL